MSFKNFVVGALLYSSIELLWRGRTHWTMAILGGIVYIFLNRIDTHLGDISIAVKAILGSAMITSLELIFGFILNIKMGLKVWNYENIGYNILGQICPKYTIYWFMLSIVAFVLIKIRNKIKILRSKEI